MVTRLHKITLEGVGEVTFRALSRGELDQLRRQARESVPGPFVATSEQVFRAYVVSEAVVSPQMENVEFVEAFTGREHLVDELASAILEVSG
jgi:hypothetical protein